METVMGLKGDNFVMLAADTMMVRKLFILNDRNSKILCLGKHTIMGLVGNEGDCICFAEYIRTSMRMYEIKNGFSMCFNTLTHFTRNHLAINLRTNPNCNVAMLLANCDPHDGPKLHFIDMQGSAHSLNYSSHGVGTPICASIFHDLWKPNITRDQAYDIVKTCVSEIQKRLVINLHNFEVLLVDEQGVVQLESLNHGSFNKPLTEIIEK